MERKNEALMTDMGYFINLLSLYLLHYLFNLDLDLASRHCITSNFHVSRSEVSRGFKKFQLFHRMSDWSRTRFMGSPGGLAVVQRCSLGNGKALISRHMALCTSVR